MNDAWSIEKELCKLAKKDKLPDALSALGLISSPQEDYTISSHGSWERGGAETYIFKFSIKTNSNINKYILKACVKFSPSMSIDKIIDEWVSRRNLISSFGISTPKLFYFGDGVLIEEFIPFTLKNQLKDSFNNNILYDLAYYSGILELNKFLTIAPFSDLRSRGDDLVVIDFGEDLGSPNSKKQTNESLFENLIKTLKKWDIKITNEIIFNMKNIFKSVDKQTIH